MTTWRILDLIKTSTDYLSRQGVPDPRLDAEYLLGHVLNKQRLDLYLIFDQPLQASELDAYRELIRRRGKREPLQHLIGETEFMGHRLRVTPDTLIPRPETEVLVETASAWLAVHEEARVLDIGTGSGCIAISLALAHPMAQITALDRYPEALAVARENAVLNGTDDRISWLKMDILQAVPQEGPFDLICSNPPYIAESEKADLQPEVRDHDPAGALFAEEAGLAFYRRFAEIFKTLLDEAGAFILELGGPIQGRQVLELFKETGYSELELITDLNGGIRFLRGRA